MKTVIMAGGMGTRIADLFPTIPKPMIPIDGVPVLEREIESLRKQGFKDIIITVSYLGSVISEYFKDGSEFGVNIEYYYEETPLGNAGALFKLRDKLTNPFFLLNADAVFDIDFNRLLDFHINSKGLVTLFTHPNSHPYDSGLIVANSSMMVEKWLTKEDIRPDFYKNRTNAGIHVINPQVLDDIDVDVSKIGEMDEITGKTIKVDLDRQVLKPLAGTGKMFCYDSPEYVKDMGTIDRYHSIDSDYKKGIVHKRNLLEKQKAIFLDRDGVINVYKGFIRDIDSFDLIPNVAKAIRMINNMGILCIVVSNQPVIARGEVTYKQLEIIHNKMETLLGLEGAYLDDIFFCPHHPDSGFEGEIKELKCQCSCRKPNPGMLFEAAKKYNINLKESYMVGDSRNDILAGNAAGTKSVLVKGIYSLGCDFVLGQAYTVEDLLEFVEKYLLNC